MNRYVLDTNICVYALARRMPSVLARMVAADRHSLVVPTLVLAELASGVVKSAKPQANQLALGLFVGQLTVEPWDEDAVWHFARESVRLKGAGQPIGNMDLLIACQAMAKDDVLVTHNTREFERVQGLKLEDWAA